MAFKKYRFTFLLLFLLPFFFSCKRTNYCTYGYIQNLRFIGFDSTEIDSIYIRGYTPNQGFINQQDSIVGPWYSAVVDTIGLTGNPSNRLLRSDLDWEIILAPINRTTRITNYTLKKVSIDCEDNRGCLCYGVCEYVTCPVISYEQNGARVEKGAVVEIRK